ncbi:MAG: hypothetical protein ACE5FU_12540, partial [Nitrospinota bacterium]
MTVQKIVLVLMCTFLFSSAGFPQTPGCVFLEGLELSCFGGGASCECEDYFTEEEMEEACQGTLPPAPPGCTTKCGRACCDTHCSTWKPSDHSICEICEDCDITKRGTISLSCDEQQAVNIGKKECGIFTYGCGPG